MKLRTVLSPILAAAAGALAMWLWQRPAPVPPKVDLSGLQAQLKAVADKNLVVPTLQTRSVEVKVTPTELKMRFLGTMQMAETLGGVARQGLDRGLSRVVLATVPADRLELFLAGAAEGRLDPAAGKGTAAELVDCEVILVPE